MQIKLLAMILILASFISACAGINLPGLSAPSANQPSQPSASGRPSTVKIGDLAPEINLRTMSGEQVVLSGWRGKAVLVNFWATWCGPCRAEFPAFVRKMKEYEGKGFVILGVNTQDENTDDGVQTFMRNSVVNFPIVRDLDGKAARAYRVTGLPTSIFIDRTGIVRDIIIGGPITDAKLDEEFAKLN